MKRVPILGRVAAGSPVGVSEAKEGMLPIPAHWANTGSHFALQVEGDSMEGAGIFENDYVIARQTPVPKDGDIVVATIDGETTLKKFRRARGQFYLVAENPRYSPIAVTGNQNLVVLGVVVGLLRSYDNKQPNGRGR